MIKSSRSNADAKGSYPLVTPPPQAARAAAALRKGFSLVELSIVLVILGLLTGGILAGQALIRASELRSYSTSVQRVQAAVNTFRDKYFALPGDMNNATSFWGVLAGTGADATCQDTAATTAATCNGNGDGIISTSVVANDERFRAWQQLANAGLIEGAYTGKTNGASGTFVLVAGSNVPNWKGGGTGDLNTAANGTTIFRADGARGGLVLSFRNVTTSTQPLSPEETWNIDTKMDDGRPGYGIVIGPKNTWASSPGCSTTDVSATSVYDLSNPAKICRFDYQIF